MAQRHPAQRCRLGRPLIFSAALALLAAGAVAGDGTIDILPNANAVAPTPGVTISLPGSYVLVDNVTMTDPDATAIVITGDDVTLDLNGHTLTGGGTFSTFPPIGIEVQGSSVRICNGTVRGFDFVNIALSGQDGWVHGVHVADGGNDGISVGAVDCLIEDCRVTGCPGNGIFDGPTSHRLTVRGCDISGNGDGIETQGDNCHVLDNSLSANTVAIRVPGGAANTIVSGNMITGNTTGISETGTNSAVANNIASGNGTNYSSVSPVTSLSATNEWGDNLQP